MILLHLFVISDVQNSIDLMGYALTHSYRFDSWCYVWAIGCFKAAFGFASECVAMYVLNRRFDYDSPL